MLVRQRGERTQIAVLEDGILVEHYVNRASATSFVGNVYLGKVQNVLPSMEAAFVDIGKGRNAVLYAGEVNWDAAGLVGQPRRIESALKPGDPILAQVTKDPIGSKGSRLTSQISLPGRYLVYVPDGSMTGISRKLPDTERTRLKTILKRIVPEEAGVIVRTAAEGASEEELARDVERLTSQWKDIARKAKSASAPALLYGEPDMTVRVIRDIFNEDFASLVVSGDDAWAVVEPYVGHVAPDLVERMSRWSAPEDLFAAYRVDEQLAKALDRKVYLPSGGSLVIDRTEAMVVIDVNTGKFTGRGGDLEGTVTQNNLEAAEEIVRQLRLRDLGGIIVVDFIDMVLESNRELVMRRLLECLGRDRTKHQVAETTSLGLVQMTRKRVGQGLLEVFSETCDCCGGRGLIVHMEPVDTVNALDEPGRRDRPRSHDGPRPVPRPVPHPASATLETAVVDTAVVDTAVVDTAVVDTAVAAPAPEDAALAGRSQEPVVSTRDAAILSEAMEEEPSRPRGRRGRRSASAPAGPAVRRAPSPAEGSADAVAASVIAAQDPVEHAPTPAQGTAPEPAEPPEPPVPAEVVLADPAEVTATDPEVVPFGAEIPPIEELMPPLGDMPARTPTRARRSRTKATKAAAQEDQSSLE
jgi:ribonuclease E